jgi:hypothetical protein
VNENQHQGVPVWIVGDDVTREWIRNQLASRLSLASAIAGRLDPLAPVKVLAPSKAEPARLARLDTGGIWDGPGLARVKELVIGLVRDFLSSHARGAVVFEHALSKPTDSVVRHIPRKAFVGDEVYSWLDPSDDEAAIRAAVAKAWNFRFSGFLTTAQPSRRSGHDQQLSMADVQRLAEATSGVLIDAFDGESVVAAWLPSKLTRPDTVSGR